MEQLPHGDGEDYHRPPFEIDLSGPDGNVFALIGVAREHLTGYALEQFNHEISVSTNTPGTKYHDILAIVDMYLKLVDTSGTYTAYALKQEEE